MQTESLLNASLNLVQNTFRRQGKSWKSSWRNKTGRAPINYTPWHNSCLGEAAQHVFIVETAYSTFFHAAAIFFFFYKTSCHIILQLSALKSKSAVKDNPGRLILWVFKFYEANVIVLQRFHGMNFTKAGKKVLQRDKRWICVLWSFTSWVFVTDDC